jgi:hypothetical protein
MTKTFKEMDKTSNVDKVIKKFGSSMGIFFTRDDLERFGLKYGDKIRLDNAEILK